jgi:hypothetical protein
MSGRGDARGGAARIAGPALAALLAVSRAIACPLSAADGTEVAGAGVQAAWRVAGPPGAAIEPSRPFSLQVRLCPSTAELLAVDATMPAHRHGMNYRPSLHPLGDGRWRVDGLLFHMAGAWELTWDVRLGERRERLRQSVDLP